MFVTGLDDFAADVEHVAAGLPVPPVLIGHSMGAAVIERLLATRPVRAAALLSPVPPAGLLPMAARLAAEQPESSDPALAVRPGAAHGRTSSKCCGPSISAPTSRRRFSPRPPRISARNRRACCSTSRCGCTGSCRSATAFRCSCWAPRATGSRREDDVRATARHHGVEATLVPGLAHMLMLERQWEKPARALARWLATLEQ